MKKKITTPEGSARPDMRKSSLNMNKAFVMKKEQRDPKWELIDARGKVLGRLATEIADKLRGKNRPEYTAHTDSGDYVVVINAKEVVLTGDKLNSKMYDSYSGWMGGLKSITAKEMLEKHPEEVIMLAVKRMLPKSILARSAVKKLKVYSGAQHPHVAQISK